MRARGDLMCLHEPFMYDYYLSQPNRDMPYFEPQADHARTYDEVRNMILQKAETSPVFFKDMSYYVVSKLGSNIAFSKQITHCFLIRNPRASIASYYKLDNEVTLEEIGIEAQWRHYAHLTSLGIQAVVIEAEAIGFDLHKAVAKWWKAIDLEHVGSAFNWNEETPSEWQAVKAWHSSVIDSSTIRTRNIDDELVEQQRFEQALESAPHLQSYLDHHLPFYERLRGEL